MAKIKTRQCQFTGSKVILNLKSHDSFNHWRWDGVHWLEKGEDTMLRWLNVDDLPSDSVKVLYVNAPGNMTIKILHNEQMEAFVKQIAWDIIAQFSIVGEVSVKA